MTLLTRLNHLAIVVPDLDRAAAFYRDSLKAAVSAPEDLPDHGVRVVFVSLANTKIELLEPLGPDSPVAKFLDRNPDGGIHHVCIETPDIAAAAGEVTAAGIRILGGPAPKIGAHGLPVVFLHPKDWLGTLIELEQEPWA